MVVRIVAALLVWALAAGAAPVPKPAPKTFPAPSEIVAAAPAGDWVAIAPADLLVMDLAPDMNRPSTGSGLRRIVIQLMPPPFSQGWVGNIRKLAAARWWDGTSINRVQDNYVVQWGDANAEDKAKAKVLPPGLAKVPQSEYTLPAAAALRLVPLHASNASSDSSVDEITNDVAKQWIAVRAEAGLVAASERDNYSELTGVVQSWAASVRDGTVGPIHCYGMVGVGRDMPPNTGTGAELYTVIGHAPRHLDRNIALVGRVISGIEHLSSLPRGTGDLGFYKTPAERTGITSVQIGRASCRERVLMPV